MSNIKTKRKKNSHQLHKIGLRVPSTLHNILVSVWLDLTVCSRTDFRCVRITQHVKQVRYVESQEDHIFFESLSPSPFELWTWVCFVRRSKLT